MTIRQQFEAWLKERGYVFTSGGPYGLSVNVLWEVWQAGYDAGVDDELTGYVDDGGLAEAEAEAESPVKRKFRSDS